MELQQLSTIAQQEQEYSNQFHCYQWINPTILDHAEFSIRDKERIAICQKFSNLQRLGRKLYFLTTTYLPNKDYEHTTKGVDDIFKRFYTKKFLPWIQDTKYFHRTAYKKIQPITYTFRENHSPKKKANRVVSDQLNGSTIMYDFPVRLHHHSVIAVHEEHVPRIQTHLGDNTFANSRFSHQIMTSSLKEANLGAVLYSSKHWSSDREMMTFPDKLHSEKLKLWKPNEFRLQHKEYHPIRLSNGQLYRK